MSRRREDTGVGRALYVRSSRDRTVEAEQLTQFNIPEGVEVGRLGLTDRVCYTFTGPFGRCFVPLGTWIVRDAEGLRPVPKKLFEAHYRPLTVAGRMLGLGERVARKIIHNG